MSNTYHYWKIYIPPLTLTSSPPSYITVLYHVPASVNVGATVQGLPLFACVCDAGVDYSPTTTIGEDNVLNNFKRNDDFIVLYTDFQVFN